MHDAVFVPERYVLAEFASTDALLEGTKKIRERGWKNLDTHTPYAVHGIEEALGLGRPFIPRIVFAGAVLGILTAYSMMYYMNAFDWPINVANRPPHSPPTMVPVTFELGILFGSFGAFLGSLVGLFRFPQPYHPLFESENFKRASVDAFFLSIKVPEGESAERALEEARNAGAKHAELVLEAER